MTKTPKPPFAPLAILWKQDGPDVTCTISSPSCDCRVEVVIGVVDVLDTEEELANLCIEGGKLTITAMKEIFETHMDSAMMVAICAMMWTKDNADAVTMGWMDSLRLANEAAKVTPSKVPEDAVVVHVDASVAMPDLSAMVRPRTPPMMQ